MLFVCFQIDSGPCPTFRQKEIFNLRHQTVYITPPLVGFGVSKMGSRRLRQTLYMAALTALRHNPIIRALGEGLKAKGKGGKRAVAAALRKLVRLIYGVLKQGQPLDPNWANRNRAVGLGGRASDGDERSRPALASPSVATA